MIHKASLLLMAHFYILAGINHFLNPQFYLRIMPPYLPLHRELVLLSGLVEVLLGAYLLVPAWRRWAAWGTIALLVAVFPANVYQLQAGGAGMDVPLWALWLRLPIQALLIAWAYQHARAR